MSFEKESIDKLSEVISLYNDEVNANVSCMYIFMYNDESQFMMASAYKVGDRVAGNLDAGVSDEKDDEIYDIICGEIFPELEEIYQKYNMPMPVEFRVVYNTVSGAFDCDYRYEKDLDDDYNCTITAQHWLDSFKADC
ncbi:MAG: hypothetical protein IJP10_00465 [Clostridia bacterium]|nr:hypothetical protein [Clostridia bacterium]